jgi:lycopene cyclase domain-containing protein
MNSNLEYLIVLLLCLFFPLGLYFHPKYTLKGRMLIALSSISLSAIPYLIWDVWATDRGHWSFNTKYITGNYIYNLPVEEVLFFFVIPFCILFCWTLISTTSSFKELFIKFISF